jgi:thymidylate synthase (FAD)
MKYIKVAVPDDLDPKDYTFYYQKDALDPDGNHTNPLEIGEAWVPQYRTMLNKGFLGLVDFMGGDQTVVDAARMSYGAGTRRVQEDRNLIRYLIRHRHWTPVEMVEIMWHVKAPIFVFRQWHRHRMASINEYSARYSMLSDDVYYPEREDVKPQSTTNRQGRSGEMSEQNIDACLLQMRHGYNESLQAYKYLLGETETPNNSLLRQKEFVEDFMLNQIKWLEKTNPDWAPDKVTTEMIDAKMVEIGLANGLYLTDEEFHEHGGLSRELARAVMPLGSYSEMYWKSDLRNTFNFIGLRSDPHAQKEIRVYSDAMMEMLEPLAPICIAAFVDYQMQGREFSKAELDVVRKLYNVAADGGDGVAHTIEETMKEAGASKREITEFLDALKG